MRHSAACLIAVVALLGGLSAPAGPPAAGAEADDPAAERQEEIDTAIDRALKHLSERQRDDGAFEGGKEGNTAITSLAAMAFLAKGHTPGTGPYGEVINKAVDFVVASQRENGLLLGHRIANGPMYSHGIATLMLSEVSGMLSEDRQKRVDAAQSRALKLILDAQNHKKRGKHDEGGWRYQPNSPDSDISCTGWQLMALRSARTNGAPVPKEAIEEGIEFILRCHDKDGGFKYKPRSGGAGLGRTGTALLCLELTGHHDQPITRKAGDFILRDIGVTGRGKRRIKDGHFFYATYYCSQAMFQLGGEYWRGWASVMYPQLLESQRKDGSWRGRHGSTYCTAMSVLAMGVVYRQLPIYQR